VIIAASTLLGCGGGEGSDDTAASAAALASDLASVRSGDVTAAPESMVAEAGTMTEAEIGDLVCTALAAIVADMAVTPYAPEAVQAQFGLKTLASSDAALSDPATFTAGADAAATSQCPEDRTVVLAAAEQDSLAAMLG